MMRRRVLSWAAILFALTPGLGLAAQPGPGTPAPAWQLKDLNGQTVQLSNFKGKVVVLHFWVTWYPPCRAEISNLVALQKQDKDKGLAVVGMAVDDGGPGVVSAFIKAHQPLDYSIVMSDDDTKMEYGGIENIPTTVIIDRHGLIAHVHSGPTDRATLKKEVEKLL